MSEIYDWSDEDTRQITETSLHVHLDYFTGQLMYAAEQRFHRTMRGIAFSAAVGGVALFNERPMPVVAQETLEAHNGMDIVTGWWPTLVHRSEADWDDAITEVWAKVRFNDEARVPEDHTVLGYVELLDAIRMRTAHYMSVAVR